MRFDVGLAVYMKSISTEYWFIVFDRRTAKQRCAIQYCLILFRPFEGVINYIPERVGLSCKHEGNYDLTMHSSDLLVPFSC